MQTAAIVNYHTTEPGQQTYYIDAGGKSGQVITPVLDPTKVLVQDLRSTSTKLDFEQDSIVFIEHESSITDFDGSNDWQAIYDRELTSVLAQQLGLKEVIVFDHTVRIDRGESDRQPVRYVHTDYSVSGAHQRLEDLIGSQRAKQWEQGHFAFINVWRPIRAPITSAPLGFVLPQSTVSDDWIDLTMVYPDRVGKILGLLASDRHEWVYLSEMTPQEIAIFNIYDNQGLQSIGHSALDLLEPDARSAVRMSVESRTLVRYE
ncbi:MAG: hypothetical protein KTR16_06965 [Acidiferrobacterales bacterium]|nr:hypothetical protein [Acidiferrobacterales bacterium]